jgi:hypothetical protein
MTCTTQSQLEVQSLVARHMKDFLAEQPTLASSEGLAAECGYTSLSIIPNLAGVHCRVIFWGLSDHLLRAFIEFSLMTGE